MSGMLTYQTDLDMIDAYLASKGPVTLRLFVNDFTPAKGDGVAQYTEAVGGGYEPRTLSPSLWASDMGPPALAVYPQQAFGFTGEVGLIYGYYLVNGLGVLIGAERFSSGPFDVRRSGDIIRVTPSIALKPQS